MSDFDQPTSTLYDVPPKRRPSGTRLGERLARTFGGFDRTQDELPEWEAEGDYEFSVEEHASTEIALRRRVAELEYELERIQSKPQAEDAVAAEIQRIGEQTSSILLVAHEQATEIKRDAQQQADRCLQDAASNAVKITSEAKQRLGELDVETDAVWQERSRLLDDARSVAAQMLSLVEDAAKRFPEDADKAVDPQATIPAPFVAPEPDATDQQ